MTNWSQGISVVVPTYKRPEGIAVALRSLRSQTVEERPIEIIVADNDPLGSARIKLSINTSRSPESPMPATALYLSPEADLLFFLMTIWKPCQGG